MRPLELIIIDDGSSDRTGDICREFSKRHKWIHFQKQENAGVSATTNRMLKRARGDYIALLASDDVYEPEKLEVQWTRMEQNPHWGASFTHVTLIDQYSNPLSGIDAVPFNQVFEREGDLMDIMVLRNVLCAPTAMLRRWAIDKVGDFDVDNKVTQDYDYWLRMLKLTSIGVVPKKLVRYRFHGGNLSGRDKGASFKETLKVLERHIGDLLEIHGSVYRCIARIVLNLGIIAYESGLYEKAIPYFERYRLYFRWEEFVDIKLLDAYMKTSQLKKAEALAKDMSKHTLLLSPHIADVVRRILARANGN
jgi:glycosyltransferase involved in cell wall biosynthesis